MSKLKPKWFLGEQRGSSKDFPLMPANLTLYQITSSSKFAKAIGIKWNANFILDMGLDGVKNYVLEDQYKDICRKSYNKLRKNPNFQKKLVQEFVKRVPNFLKFCKIIYENNLKEKTNAELWQDYEKYIRLYEDIYIWGEPFAFAARFQLADYLSEYLKERLQKFGQIGKKDDYFNILITPHQKTFITEEKEKLLQIAFKISKSYELKDVFKKELKIIAKNIGKYPALNKQIEEHTKNYRWMPYNYGAYLFTKKYFLKELKAYNDKNLVQAELYKIDKIYKNLKRNQNSIAKELKIDKHHQDLFDALRYNSFIIDYKKRIFTISHFYINFSLMKEIAKRLKIKQNLTHCLLKSEINEALLQNKLVPLNNLEQRYARTVIFISNGEAILYTGKKAEQFLEKQGITQEKLVTAQEVRGQIANRGIAKGKVKIITGSKSFSKMKKGEIVVTHMTTPEFIPILKKAIAIITDEGGITSHAAIISRELNIPCIIGTKIATRFFKDNDLVEVNANAGIIKILNRKW